MPYPMTIPQYSMPVMMARGGLASAAQNVQRQGRNGDSMLVHMTPEEVGGLQALARSQGGSLTINPETGLPEANFLKNMLPTILGIGGTFLGIPPHLTAMAVGGLETARSGDLGKGILAGLGAYGGANMASSFGAAGGAGAASTAPTVAPTELLRPDTFAGEAISNYVPADVAIDQAVASLPASAPTAAPSFAQQAGQGFQNVFASGPTGDTARSAFLDKAGGYSGLAADVSMAASPALLAQPEFSVPPPRDEGSNYAGPYTPSDRGVRFPDEDRRRRTSEFSFFENTNPVPFAEGGNVEDRSVRMPGADYVAGQMPEFNHNFQPVGIEGRNQFGMTPEQMGQYAMGDVLSRMNESVGGPPGVIGGLFNIMGQKMKDSANPYVDLSTYQYDPQSQRMVKGMAQGGLAALKAGGLREGAFIVPADVISHLGNGSSEAGMKIIRERLNARPIKGPGDGMSDSIPTTIAGRQKARVANEEAEIPPEVVASLGGGSMEKGAKKLYEMMDEVRQARTGKKKQAPQIRADKHVPA